MLDIIKFIDESNTLSTILQLILAAVSLYLLPKLPTATKSFIDWGKAQAGGVKNAYAAGVLQRLIDLVGQMVLKAENTLVEELKAAAADGKITKEELTAALLDVKKTVIDEVKSHASAQGLWSLAVGLFLGGENDLMKWVDGLVEATVSKLPASGLQSAKGGEAPAFDPAKLAVQVGNAVSAPVVPQTAAL